MQNQSKELAEIRDKHRETFQENLERYNQTRTEILSLQKTKKELQDKIDQGAMDMEEKIQQVKQQEMEKRSQLEMEIVTLRGDKQSLEDLNMKLQKSIEKLTEEHCQIKEQLLEKESEIEQVVVSKDPTEEAEMKYLQQKCTDSMNELQESKSKCDELSHEVLKYKSLSDQMMEDLKQIQQIKSQVEENNKELSRKCEELDLAMSTMKNELSRVRETNNRLVIEKQDLVAMNNELQSRQSYSMTSGSSGPESCLNNFKELERSVRNPVATVDDNRQQAVSEIEHPQEQKGDLATASREDSEVILFDQRDRSSSDTQNKKSKSELTVHDLLVQLQSEREKVTEYQQQLHIEQSKVTRLEQNLQDTKQRLQASTSHLDTTVSQLQQEHKDKVKNLMQQLDSMSAQVQAAQERQHNESLESTGDDIQALKSQVMSLVNELRDTEIKLNATREHINKYRNRCITAENKLTMLQDEYEDRCKKDGHIIDTLRVELQNYDAALNTEMAALQQERSNLKETAESHEKLCAEYDNLWKMYNNLSGKGGQRDVDPRVLKEKDNEIDNLTAQLVSADEAIAAKEDEVKELRNKIREMKNELETVPVLKAQADIYQADFQAEREAREKAHGEKEKLVQDIQDLQLENQQLQDDLNTLSKTQIAEMQKRHGKHEPRPAGAAGYTQPGRGYPYPGPYYPRYYADGNNADERKNEPAPQGIVDGMGGSQGDRLLARGDSAEQISSGTDRSASPVPHQFTCPKCEAGFPDLDTLQIHILDCIN
ncbi:uncharacterized protein LOC100375641 isoform X2 [Saccoglossus kowalevskii]